MNVAKSLNRDVSSIFGTSRIKRQVFESITAMVKSGIDIVQALEGLAGEQKNSYQKQLIEQIAGDLHEGIPLWEAFERQDIIPKRLNTIVRIGEESGTLPQSMNAVQKQMSKNRLFRSRIRSASVYPMFVTGLLLIVGTVVVGIVLPRLVQIYNSLNTELPLITKIVKAIGEFFLAYGHIFFPIFFTVIAVTVYVLFINKRTKGIGDSLVFRLPLIHKVLLEVQTARMGQMLNNLLVGGIDIEKSLQILADSTDFWEYRKLYQHILDNIREGKSLSYSLRTFPKIEYFLPLEAQLLITNGEQTGEIMESLDKIAVEFEQRTETSAKDFGTLFEPILILVVWVGVAILAFSVILPLYGVVGDIGDIASTGSEVRDVSAGELDELDKTVDDVNLPKTSGETPPTTPSQNDN